MNAERIPIRWQSMAMRSEARADDARGCQPDDADASACGAPGAVSFGCASGATDMLDGATACWIVGTTIVGKRAASATQMMTPKTMAASHV